MNPPTWLAVFSSAWLAASAFAQSPVPAAACQDFNAYVNGAWAAATEMPADRASIGSFDEVQRNNNRVLKDALAELVAEPARQTTPGLRRLAAHYRSGMDETGIAQRGLASLAPWLARVAAVDRAGLPTLLGELARLQVDLPLRLFVNVDAKEATRFRLLAQQGGLGLPDRDDYFKSDTTTQRVTAGYRSYVQRLLQAAALAVDPNAPSGGVDNSAPDGVVALESELARAHMTPVQRRDPAALYNPHTGASLQALAPGMDWPAWLQAYAGAQAPQSIVLGQPELARALAVQLQTAPLQAWRDCLRVRLLDSVADHLPPPLAQARFDYHSGVLRGLQAPPPRVERVIAAIGGPRGIEPLGEALGELYISKAFSAQAQSRALQMVQDIRAAMRQRISGSPWMSPATQQQALAKLEAMVAQIGAPTRWQDYQGLDIHGDDYAGNALRARAGHAAPPGRAGAAGGPPALEQQRRLHRQRLCRQRQPHRLSGRHLAAAVF